jgi:hypothetical protein
MTGRSAGIVDYPYRNSDCPIRHSMAYCLGWSGGYTTRLMHKRQLMNLIDRTVIETIMTAMMIKARVALTSLNTPDMKTSIWNILTINYDASY